MFSKTCEYAIKIMIHVASASGPPTERVGLSEISDSIGSPRAFTAKTLQLLTRAGLLESARGPKGGFNCPAERSISLAEIVSAIDGDELFKGCVLGFKVCSDECPCPVHHRFSSVRDHLAGTLFDTHLEELTAVLNDKQGFLTDKERSLRK